MWIKSTCSVVGGGIRWAKSRACRRDRETGRRCAISEPSTEQNAGVWKKGFRTLGVPRNIERAETAEFSQPTKNT
jgi:hypothetical protein